jgi:hypothetical protein
LTRRRSTFSIFAALLQIHARTLSLTSFPTNQSTRSSTIRLIDATHRKAQVMSPQFWCAGLEDKVPANSYTALCVISHSRVLHLNGRNIKPYDDACQEIRRIMVRGLRVRTYACNVPKISVVHSSQVQRLNYYGQVPRFFDGSPLHPEQQESSKHGSKNVLDLVNACKDGRNRSCSPQKVRSKLLTRKHLPTVLTSRRATV